MCACGGYHVPRDARQYSDADYKSEAYQHPDVDSQEHSFCCPEGVVSLPAVPVHTLLCTS